MISVKDTSIENCKTQSKGEKVIKRQLYLKTVAKVSD